MKSPRFLLASLCLVAACAATPSLAMAGVNVVIGVAPPVHYYGTRGYIVTPGYSHWQSHNRVWVPERRHYPGGYYAHEANRWHGSRHFDSRSHWGNQGWGNRSWDQRGGHDDHDRGHHGHR